MGIDAPWRARRFEECGDDVASGIVAVSVCHAGGPERSYCERPLPLCRSHPVTASMRGSWT